LQQFLGETRIEFASPPGAPAGTRASSPESREACPDLARNVCAPIVRRQDLHVLDVAPAVGPEVLDLKVGKLDAPINKGEVVGFGPPAHLVGVSPGSAVAVAMTPVWLLEEHLVVALEVLLEDHTLDMRSFLHQSVGRPEIGSIKLRVVSELAVAREPILKELRRLVVTGAMSFEQLATAIRQRHEIGACLPINGRDVPEQPFTSQMLNVTVPQVGVTIAVFTEVIDRDNAERTDDGKRPDL
jgi:hypothetical protein